MSVQKFMVKIFDFVSFVQATSDPGDRLIVPSKGTQVAMFELSDSVYWKVIGMDPHAIFYKDPYLEEV